MIFRTLLFFVLMYLLIKVISRLFVPSQPDNKNSDGSGFFYTFNNQQQQGSNSSGNRRKHFDNIEEAEFEDITDEEKTSSKSSD